MRLGYIYKCNTPTAAAYSVLLTVVSTYCTERRARAEPASRTPDAMRPGPVH